MTTLYTNIACLAGIGATESALRGKELAALQAISNAWLLIEDAAIAGYGDQSTLPVNKPANIIDVQGGTILPAWCDSHTHLVFGASREQEFVDKIKGLSYAEIAAKGGGILHSAHQLASLSEDELFRLAWQRLQEANALGTGAIEIKSGYGLTVASELKMLRVIRRLKEKAAAPIKASFLGAHAYPAAYKENHEGYLRLIEEEMLPVIAAEKLADYIDVFCEDGFFSAAETERILMAGKRYGLKPKMHANQLHLSGGVQVGVKHHAISVDHLETMDADAIQTLASASTIGTLLPTAAFFLRMAYQPARQLIDAGAAIALATDFNPGSSPGLNMHFVVSLACIQMKMLPEEAINAATINGAAALELQRITGSISKGKRADFIITKPIPSLAYIPYAFSTNQVQQVLLGGVPVK